MSRTFTETVPLSILDGSDGDLVVTFTWSPGSAPSGQFGPPEHYDPGSPPEFDIVSSHYEGNTIPVGLGEHEEERVLEYLAENWEPPEDGPDPDDARDRERDDRLTERGQ